MEEWKEYLHWYYVSNIWNIRKLKDWILHDRKHCSDAQWYRQISLRINWKYKTVPIHRMVAKVFIENKNINYNIVNHKNGVKHDNRVENLEWCTQQMNSIHARETWLQWKWVFPHYVQYDKDMNFIAEYECLTDAHLATWISKWRLMYAKSWWWFHTWFYWKNK